MKKTFVSIEGNVGVIEAYVTDAKWNGFEVPFFTKETALEVLQSIQNTNADLTEEYYERYNEEYDCIEVVMRDTPEDNYRLETTYVDGVKVYNVGSGWTWTEDEPIDVAQITCDVDIEVDHAIDFLLVSLHQKFNTKSGDITPEQTERLIQLQEQLSALISEQIIQNL